LAIATPQQSGYSNHCPIIVGLVCFEKVNQSCALDCKPALD
jgi:hypothetical protein